MKSARPRRPWFLVALLLSAAAGEAQAQSPRREAEPPQRRLATGITLYPKRTTPRPRFEATVATAQLFATDLIGRYGDDTKLVPTTSVVFIADWIAAWWLRVSLLYDLPTSAETRFVKGTAVQAELPSRLAVGLVWSPLYVDFATRSRVEFQALTYIGLTLEEVPRPVPILGGRVVVLTNADAGVGIYVGFLAELVINQIGVVYGVGYRF